jgi:hypothetical protein
MEKFCSFRGRIAFPGSNDRVHTCPFSIVWSRSDVDFRIGDSVPGKGARNCRSGVLRTGLLAPSSRSHFR